MTVVPGGLRVAVRLTPRGGSNKVQGVMRDAEGAALLKVSVTAPPEDGKANAALVKLLAKRTGIANSLVSIVSGATSRSKLLEFRTDDAETINRLTEWGKAPS